jgi:hypothetical protein
MMERYQYATIIAGIGGIFVLLAVVAITIASNHMIDIASSDEKLLGEIQRDLKESVTELSTIKNELATNSSQGPSNTIGKQVSELNGQITKTLLINNETGHGQVWLPEKPGITYRGHITLNSVDYPICDRPNVHCFPNPVMILCGLPGHDSNSTSTTTIQPLVGTPVIAGHSNVDQEFSCTSLFEDGFSETTGIYGVIHYIEVKS